MVAVVEVVYSEVDGDDDDASVSVYYYLQKRERESAREAHERERRGRAWGHHLERHRRRRRRVLERDLSGCYPVGGRQRRLHHQLLGPPLLLPPLICRNGAVRFARRWAVVVGLVIVVRVALVVPGGVGGSVGW